MERLRNIRDMFEHSGQNDSDDQNYQPIERSGPSEKLLERLSK